MVNKNMTVLDLLNRHPETIPIFKEYDQESSICICCDSLFDTLETVALKYRLNLEKLLSDLKKVLENSGKK